MFLILLCSSTRFILDSFYIMTLEKTQKTYEVIMSVQVAVFFHVNIVFVRLDVMVVMLKEQSSPLGIERYSHANSFLRSS